MRNLRISLAIAAFIGLALLGNPTIANAQTDTDTQVTVLITDLVADVPILTDRNGIVHTAARVDPNLVNPWGLTESSGSPFWVSDNNQGVATLYSVPGANNTPVSINSLVVSIPVPSDPLNPKGAPTGTVFNIDGGANGGFRISGVTRTNAAVTASSIFLFATEDGTIVGWNPGVNPTGFNPTKAGTYGIIAVDNSANPTVAVGAVYKGLAIAKDNNGNTFLYATNFRAGTVEVYDSSFNRVTFSADAFTDPKLPSGFAPFNIVLLGNVFFVTYAKQDAAKHDNVPGEGRGLVNKFDLQGHMIGRFAQHGQLDSPWGLVQAPASFGQFAGAILIGNFGNGHINAYDPNTGEFLAKVGNSLGQIIEIDGLWALRVGNNGAGGNSETIYFTAGPNGESDGLFGSLNSVAPGTPCGTPCR